MNIVIEIAGNADLGAFIRAKAVAHATELNDINFSGDVISVVRGDYTCISEGDGHSDAGKLFATIQDALQNEFEVEIGVGGAVHTLIPFSGGGVVRALDDSK